MGVFFSDHEEINIVIKLVMAQTKNGFLRWQQHSCVSPKRLYSATGRNQCKLVFEGIAGITSILFSSRPHFAINDKKIPLTIWQAWNLHKAIERNNAAQPYEIYRNLAQKLKT